MSFAIESHFCFDGRQLDFVVDGIDSNADEDDGDIDDESMIDHYLSQGSLQSYSIQYYGM